MAWPHRELGHCITAHAHYISFLSFPLFPSHTDSLSHIGAYSGTGNLRLCLLDSSSLFPSCILQSSCSSASVFITTACHLGYRRVIALTPNARSPPLHPFRFNSPHDVHPSWGIRHTSLCAHGYLRAFPTGVRSMYWTLDLH